MLLDSHITQKLKRYLLYISITFFLGTLIHILYIYLYSGAKNIPLGGGTISEAVIGDFPHLNPLIYSSDYNKYIINNLYRSLLRYDYKEDKIVADLANCDIKNLLYIECFLNENNNWSDGTSITLEDVKMTYEVLKSSPSLNPIISSLLSETEISTKENTIIFSNTKSDINFLNILLMPIVSSEVLNTISVSSLSANFPTEGAKYSGYFTLGDMGKDETLGIKKLTLDKNSEYPNNPILLDRIVLKIFDDTAHFLKHKDTINVFTDKSNLIGNSVPRLQTFSYTMPQYIAAFLNIESLPDNDLRTFILDKIDRDNIVNVLGGEYYASVYNPYITDIKIDKSVTLKNIDQILAKLGFYKQPELIRTFLETAKKNEPTQSGIVIEPPKKRIDINEKLNYIISPTNLKYNFALQDDILLKGEVRDSSVTAVYINDYKLQGFTEGDTYFYYRLKGGDFDTIKTGENIYKVSFEKNGVKEQKEEVVYYLGKDVQALEKYKADLVGEKEISTDIVVLSGSTDNQNRIEPSELLESDQNQLKELEALDDKFFYNKKGEPYTISLWYLDTDRNMLLVAENVKSSLAQFGITVSIRGVSMGDFNKLFQAGDKSYDILLAGINLGYFDFNIFPYFHSSQIKNGYNFSNYKKLGLDIILEELKGTKVSEERIDKLEEDVLKMLKEDAVVKTIYTPKLKQLVDKNIQNYSFPSYVKDDSVRMDAMSGAYLLERRIINLSDKGVFNFFGYLFTNLF